MPTARGIDWRRDFGIEGRRPPNFFAGASDLDAAPLVVPQAHVLRRAFEDLGLSGVLCQDNAPLIYFRLEDRIEPAKVAATHRLFWNQGVAPILVFIDPEQVQVYSGLTPLEPSQSVATDAAGFVERLERVAGALQRFVLAVESGEYFHHHRRAFDPRQRVDRTLLTHLRDARKLLAEVPAPRLEPHTLDGLLCRLVFTCYLFDREVIDRKYLETAGIADADHLRDILGKKPRTSAKTDLYKLFKQLGEHFNGDLFSEDLDDEARQVKADHLDILDDLFRGTNPQTRQQRFWPFDFGIIPIETISAIYEHFLKASGDEAKRDAGAFYTPRFVAEVVLDRGLDGMSSLLEKRFLDPACGSGIFLVGLFNRLAEVWNRANPDAKYDARLRGLTSILTTNLFGIDESRSACLIAAFSLCLALLDQLTPPDIRRVLRKMKVLPKLVANAPGTPIHCGDFFSDTGDQPQGIHLVVGNPPWATATSRTAPVAKWCVAQTVPFPGRQMATAFVWKAPVHLDPIGKVCFVLPHGILFNHNPTAVEFQKELFRRHAAELILNLADFQRFLFEDAEAPAVVVKYAKERPANTGHRIDYWAPKADWAVTQAEVLAVLPQDRSRLTVREVLDDLDGEDAPLIWKERYWATARDRRLLDRLRLNPRLRDIIGQRGSRDGKPWIIAEGFEPFGALDRRSTLHRLSLPQAARVEAGTHALDLFVLRDDCNVQSKLEIDVRRRISDTEIFKAPLVLVTEGFSKIAYADLDIAYRHGIRGIHGPPEDASLLAFLAVYLRSSLARYFLFHTSASWGVSRARVDVDDLMRLPFPVPAQSPDPARANTIVTEVAGILADAMKEAPSSVLGREGIAERAQVRAEKLVEEYFDIDDIERSLIADTVSIVIPSVRPTRARVDVPTIMPASGDHQAEYVKLLSQTLSGWARKDYQLHSKAVRDLALGVGMVVLEKTHRGAATSSLADGAADVLAVLHRLQRGAARNCSTVELVRGLKVFEKNLLYVIKPLGRRFWTPTAALNDADEIAATLVMRPEKGDA